MLNITLTLNWPDGAQCVARMQGVVSPQADCVPAISGDASRVRVLPKQTTAPLFTRHLRLEAQRTGAACVENWEGEYDRFAE